MYKRQTPIRGILLGTGVTAVIQSSSATSVMVVGFVNSGMMKVRQAIGIVLGAILGTSVTGWIICLSDLSGGSGWVQLLSTATLTGIIAVIGIIPVSYTHLVEYRTISFSCNPDQAQRGTVRRGVCCLPCWGKAAQRVDVYKRQIPISETNSSFVSAS